MLQIHMLLEEVLLEEVFHPRPRCGRHAAIHRCWRTYDDKSTLSPRRGNDMIMLLEDFWREEGFVPQARKR